MADFTALYDACVLYPASLRDLLMQLSQTGLFRARWTDAIQEEWISNLLDNEPTRKRSDLERTRILMNEAVLDATITGYESLIDGIQLPDPDDRHVLAAAIRGRADVIVTFNTKDFPPAVLSGYGIALQTPDEFVCRLLTLDQATVRAAVKTQRTRLRKPPMTAERILESFERQRLVEFVKHLRPFIDEL